jgi:hypothetical protein
MRVKIFYPDLWYSDCMGKVFHVNPEILFDRSGEGWYEVLYSEQSSHKTSRFVRCNDCVPYEMYDVFLDKELFEI